MSSVENRTHGPDAGTGRSEVVRLSINLASDVAAVLRKWADIKHISATEAVRRAIAVWNFIETEKANGNSFAVVENLPGGKQRMREVVLID
ncbi:CopG family transcriptional regulator [Nocardia terpenica]|uniref:Ribbon-helix-helix protein CopG domain-containing protein n=1 Tax=Nocardia terpenica TaxID=455432 RepID=A0A164HHK1_9NOCA|nr:hypothetical protein [Nocardia terpenica]KZM68520.1 hypothetical protein AWN90_11675 [Nocardia terpenica]MBF6064955.1 CopG family transcriptional regulator [Nocardia terpenica]MBF6115227.1 CopG family transcriptional regulator [Nocardia terpenica]MBF6122549.1 CopG family transcriptional regulator [Nocardia terpenica]NQE88525.1 CopG family transcriptional regulator [Nocardia terpenica]